MGLEFLGGLANAYNGFTQGQDRELSRQQLAKDREYQSSQREFSVDQQARTIREQGRDDEFQKKIESISPTEDVVQYGDLPKEPEMSTPGSNGYGLTPAKNEITGSTDFTKSSSTPSALPKIISRQKSQSEMAMEYGKALLNKPGGFERGMEMMKHAAGQTMLQAGYKINELESNSGGKSLFEVAGNAAKIFNADAYAGNISDLKENPDGSVSLVANNKETGQKIPITYKSQAELFNGMRAHYSPEVFGQILAAQRANSAKIAEKHAKGVELAPGAIHYDYDRNGNLVEVASNKNLTAAEARMQGLEMRIAAGLGGGSGGKAEKPVGPKMTTYKDENNVEQPMDELTGARVVTIPGTPFKSGNGGALIPNWIRKETPDTPEVKSRKVWALPDGTELPGGLRDIYPQIPAIAGKGVPATPVAQSASPTPAAARQAQPPKPTSRAEYNQIPRGTQYQAADGTMKIKG